MPANLTARMEATAAGATAAAGAGNPTARPGASRLPDLSWALWVELLVVLAIFLVALALRTWQLQQWPPGLFSDEAAYGLDAVSVLNGARPIFFPRNTGREPLFPYLEAGMMALLGQTPFALRLTAAILGALAVPATYWMVRELFRGSPLGSRRMALWSTLFLAFGYWHISLNRIAFRANMLPLLAAITFALFWRAWHKLLAGERFPWLWTILTGAALGVTLYTYTAGRFMPILLTLVVLATILPRGVSRRTRRHAIGALALIAATSAVVFAPLGWYFLQHPDQFAGRAAAISIFSPEWAAEGPVEALVRTAGETAFMFLTVADPNLRHNPGLRPVFDLPLGLWMYAGLILCLIYWRKLPYLFLAVWTLLLALPAVLAAEATPHSLRAIGVIPAVYVLPVLAMLAAAAWLTTRLAPAPAAASAGDSATGFTRAWTRWLVWLPLPFLLFSAASSLQGYFGAFSDLGRFNGVFMTNYAKLAADMARAPRDGVWLLTLSPNYFHVEATFSTMDFLTAGKADYAGILVDPEVVGDQLAAVPGDKRNLRLVLTQDSPRFPEASYILGDPKHLARFVLDKYGIQTGEHDDSTLGMPYVTYALPPRAGYPAFGRETPLDVPFDGKLTVTGAGYGRTAQDDPAVDVDSQVVPAGDPLWVTLRWRADVPIDLDLKTSLTLRSAAGQVAGQVDDLLVGDRYPVERVWEPGETASSYHILRPVSGLAPGRYDLVLRVYEDQTLRPYPVVDAAGAPVAADTVIGSVEIVAPRVPQVVTPQQPLDAQPELVPGLQLLGYDLPATTIAPGETLPLTLYWHAPVTPTVDYTATLQLRPTASTGADAVASVIAAIGGAYPTSRWPAGTTIRDWHELPSGPDVPNGSYTLWLTIRDGSVLQDSTGLHDGTGLQDGTGPLGELALGEVTVVGRPREFSLPPVALPLRATFGQSVQLVGLATALPPTATAGSSVDLAFVWQVQQPPGREIVRFVHLLGPDGRPVAQVDSVPCAGACPAASWVGEEVLRDTVTLPIPPAIPPGAYTLAAGWYDAGTLSRLEARDAAGAVLPDSVLRLQPLTVTQP